MPDLPDWLKIVLAITPVVAGATAIVMRGIARLNERLKDIQIRIGAVEQQNRALIKALPAVISA